MTGDDRIHSKEHHQLLQKCVQSVMNVLAQNECVDGKFQWRVFKISQCLHAYVCKQHLTGFGSEQIYSIYENLFIH